MLKKIMMTLLLTGSTFAFAGGDRVGNGGDVIVCGKRAELLDLYELRLRKINAYVPAGKNYKEMLESLITNKLKPIQPLRAERYLAHLKSFETEADLYPNIVLNDVDDAGMVVVPKGCKLAQIAIQLSDSERPPGKKRYTISLDLWNKLDEFNKMSLVLHEIVYREAIQFPTSSSMFVRAMVGEIIREEIDLKHFLVIDANLSRSIEFKKMYISGLKQVPEISILKNEYGEDVLELSESSDLLYSSYVSFNGFSQVSLRMNDGKVLIAKNRNDYVAAFIRENSALKLYDLISFSPSKEIEWKDGKFISKTPFDLTIYTAGENNFEINLQDVSDFQAVKSSWPIKSIIYKGNFTLDYQGIQFKSSQKSFLEFYYGTSYVKQYKIEKGTTKFILEGQGIFNCLSFNAYDNNVFNFEKCSPENTEFRIVINYQEIDVLLASKATALILRDYYLVKPVDVFIRKKVYLGKKFENQQDIFIEPGEYKVESLEYNSTKITAPSGDTYYLKDGYVSLLEN